MNTTAGSIALLGHWVATELSTMCGGSPPQHDSSFKAARRYSLGCRESQWHLLLNVIDEIDADEIEGQVIDRINDEQKYTPLAPPEHACYVRMRCRSQGVDGTDIPAIPQLRGDAAALAAQSARPGEIDT